jgi:hypothetical protein
MGWGNYAPRQKSNEQLALERRRELGKQFPGSLDELVQLAAKCKKKPKVLPPGPPLDDVVAPAEPEPALMGPCQEWTRHWKAVRAAKAAGQVEVVAEDEPYVDERQQKLLASRAYYQKRKAKRAKT